MSAVGGTVALASTPALASAKKRGRNRKKGRRKGRGRGRRGSDNGPPPGTKNTCPDGTVLLAKYEVEDGKFVFEKSSDFLEAGDAFEFTINKTKDGGEVLAFSFKDPKEVYDIHTASVKTGAGIFEKEFTGTDSKGDYEGSFDARTKDDDGPVQAISNVLLCSKVFWQVDLGVGEVPQPPNYSNSDATLLRAALGDSTGKSMTTGDGLGTYKGIESDMEFDFGDGTATIGFSGNTDGRRVHLASFERPGPFNSTKNTEFGFQDLFDSVSTTSESMTLTVDVPTLDDYS
jgi:hypothetical protein